MEQREAEVRLRRILARAADFASARTVGIFGHDGSTPRFFASGVLVSVSGDALLLSAAHALRHMRVSGDWAVSGTGLNGQAVEPVPLHDGKVAISTPTVRSDPTTDPHDIGVMLLSKDTASRLAQNWSFATPSDIDLRHVADPDSWYCVLGIPKANVSTNHDAFEIDCEVLPLGTRWFTGDSTQLRDYDPEINILLDYSDRVVLPEGRVVPSVEPYGMSGCGIWSLRTDSANEGSSSSPCTLVGIQHAWFREAGAIRGTYLGHAAGLASSRPMRSSGTE